MTSSRTTPSTRLRPEAPRISVAADAMRRRSLDIGGHCSCAISAIITARMANTQSAKKRARASLRKRDRNRSTRSAVKTLVSRARRPALPEAASLTSEEVRRAISALDKAAEKGVLHANNASRRKARLMSALAKLAPAAPQPKATTTKAPAKPAPAAKKPASKPAKTKA